MIRFNPGDSGQREVIYQNRYLGEILQIVEYMDGHYQDDIRMDDLMQICHMSETHFRRKFSEYMRITPGDYINLLRVKKVCEIAPLYGLQYRGCGNTGRFSDRQCADPQFRKLQVQRRESGANKLKKKSIIR